MLFYLKYKPGLTKQTVWKPKSQYNILIILALSTPWSKYLSTQMGKNIKSCPIEICEHWIISVLQCLRLVFVYDFGGLGQFPICNCKETPTVVSQLYWENWVS